MKLLLYKGTSGAGKTTHAEKTMLWLEEQHYSVEYCSADRYFYTHEKYEFDPLKLKEAHSQCFDNFMEAIANRTNYIIVDNTNLHDWEIAPYIRLAAYYGMDIHLYKFDALPHTRRKNNVHNIPENVIVNQSRIYSNSMATPLSTELSSYTLYKDYQHVKTCYGKDNLQSIDVDIAEAGLICLQINAVDCDHVKTTTHRIIDLGELEQYIDLEYDNAEGPTNFQFYPPMDMDKLIDSKQDLIAEAHENGHPWRVSG